MRELRSSGRLVLIAAPALALSACQPNSKPTMATIATIDRTCDFIETTTSPDGVKSARGTTDSCNSTDEWDKVRDQIRDHRHKKIAGKATLHLTYTAPQDGSYRTADLKFDGSDDEFYSLQAGDQVQILVSDKDPNVIRKA